MNVSEYAYARILAIFRARLEMKHLLKGTEHREMSYTRLIEIVRDETNELHNEVFMTEITRITKVIEEALDIMIAGLLVADKAFEEMKL